MAKNETHAAAIADAIARSEANLTSMEETLGTLVALEQDRRAAQLRLDIATATDRHKALVRCAEAGCTCADDCQCGANCPCVAE